MTDKISQFRELYNDIGLDGNSLDCFLIRITQYLLLDYAIYHLEIDEKEVSPENVHKFFKDKLKSMKPPPISGLTHFIEAYKYNKGIYREHRQQIVSGNPKKCDFSVGCPVNDVEIDNEKKTKIKFHKDHIIPLSWGRNDSPPNIQFLCIRHNYLKYNRIYWDEGILPIKGWYDDI